MCILSSKSHRRKISADPPGRHGTSSEQHAESACACARLALEALNPEVGRLSLRPKT